MGEYYRSVPTSKEFKKIAGGKEGSVGKVYYYLLSCAKPHIDFESGVTMYLETTEETTGKRSELCNKRRRKDKEGSKGKLNIHENTYKSAIEILTQPLCNEDGEPIKDENGRYFRLLRHKTKNKKEKAYWTDFEIGKINVPGFLFQNIKSQTLNDLALRDNKYIVQVYAHILYICYSASNKKGEYNYTPNHLVCGKYFWEVMGWKSPSHAQKRSINSALIILEEMGLIETEHITNHGQPYKLITKVNLTAQQPKIRELSDDEVITQYNSKTHEVRQVKVKDMFKDKDKGWLAF